jgi:hypothetical protein
MNHSIGFDLFASRFWSLRTLFETDYDGPSPIVDPDLHKVDPDIPELSSPPLRGAKLSDDLLESVYRSNTVEVLERAYAD